MRLFLVLLLASSAWAARDPKKCGRVIIARAAREMGEFRLPHACPHPEFKDPYHVTPVRHGVDILSGPQGIVAVFVQPDAGSKATKIVTRIKDSCPKAPPGYRMVHALVKEKE